MHYKDGTPAEIGDVVMTDNKDGSMTIGSLVSTSAQATTCNGNVLIAAKSYKVGAAAICTPVAVGSIQYVTLKDCVLLQRAGNWVGGDITKGVSFAKASAADVANK